MAVVGGVQHKCTSGAARAAMLSHHTVSPLLDSKMRFKQIQRCRPVSSPLYSPRLPHVASSSGVFLSIVVVFLWTTLVGTALANTHADHQSPRHATLAQDDLVWEGSSLYIDHRPAPVPPLLMSPIIEPASNRGKRAVRTDPNAPNSDFTIPQPLDTGLSNNFTNACASFLNRLRNDESFKKCRPFSLMLQTSSGFFDASKSYLRITQTLDATCGVNATQCRKVMDDFARELMSATACKTDLANDNPLVIQTVNGLIAYPVAYSASCLRDNEGSYCFANAVTNLSATTDSLPYYLPVGQELPGGSRPTCNSCLQDAMSVFAQYGNNATQPISKTYSTAAQQISISCGRTFVNVTAAPLKGAAATTNASLAPQFTLFLMLILFILQ